jgi:hypothetical protein
MLTKLFMLFLYLLFLYYYYPDSINDLTFKNIMDIFSYNDLPEKSDNNNLLQKINDKFDDKLNTYDKLDNKDLVDKKNESDVSNKSDNNK